jgi:histidinol dehydrogenase
MRIVRYPKTEDWTGLLQRPANDMSKVETRVRKILRAVKLGGDDVLRDLSRTIDKAEIDDLQVHASEFEHAGKQVSKQLKEAINIAKANIENFHRVVCEKSEIIETFPGVTCWRRTVPIERVGLYVPAGSAPLFSTVLMLAIPAKLAGCREVMICTPPGPDGRVCDAILYTAKLCGVTKVFKLGGAQAIAAMAYGTPTVARVDKIFGPGNSFVTCAKQIVSKDVAIDMPAGPSEVAVLADESCEPAFVAADLLSQAEHGTDSQVVLISSTESVIERVLEKVYEQLDSLPRRKVAARALEHSLAILVRTPDEAIELINNYAPEHLILALEKSESAAELIKNAGSVFIGNYSCESAGDYASGTNHTLPTGGFARSMSGISVDSFVKKITFQKLTPEGIRNLGPTIESMAMAEGLAAHSRAISIRREALDGV